MNKTQMNPTRNNMPLKLRQAMVELLNQVLVDALDLYGAIKQAHWNIKGPRFIQIHLLLDELAEKLEKDIDEIAERATALGGIAIGTSKVVASTSRLEEYPLDITSVTEHLIALTNRYATYANALRKAIELAERDAGTADLFTQASRAADKALWILESHLQGEADESTERLATHNGSHRQHATRHN